MQNQSAVNQHAGGEFEICDPFWPYERTAVESDTTSREGYVEQVRRFLGSWRCVQVSMSAADEELSTGMFARGVPLNQIEQEIILACARKYVSHCNSGSDGAMTSFSYFENAIDETSTAEVSDDYWRYLHHRAERLEREWVGKDTIGAAGRAK